MSTATENLCDCGRPTRDNAYTCDECLGRFNRALSEIPWLVGELETTIGKQRGIDYAALGGSPSSEAPSPVNLPAVEARRALRHALVMAVRFCDEEHIRHQSPRAGLPVDQLEAMSRWLMWRVDGLGFSDMGGEFMREVTDAADRCRYLVDQRPERKYAGPCECGRDLYHKPGAVEAKCRECGRVYVVGELYEWMQGQVRDQLVTAREGAALLCRFGVETKQRTIEKWAERGRVVRRGTVRGEDGRERESYLMGDLLDVAVNASVS